jgi:Fn3-like domain
LREAADLKDTAHFDGEHIITIINPLNETVCYDLSIVHAATVLTLNDSTTGLPSQFPPAIEDSELVSVIFSPSSLQLGPQSVGNVTVNFSLVSDIDELLVPVYSGYVLVRSSSIADGGSLQIPFMGVAANMTTLELFNTSLGLPTLRSFAPSDNRFITADGSVFSMNTTILDIPTIALELSLPSRMLRLDILPADNSTFNTTAFAGLNILGYGHKIHLIVRSAKGSPVSNEPRGDPLTPPEALAWDGSFDSGGVAPDGPYRLALRALKILAENVDNEDSWDTFISPIFIVNRTTTNEE